MTETFTNERERFLRLDEAVQDTGLAEIYMIGIKRFVEITRGATADEMESNVRDFLDYMVRESGGDPTQPGPLPIPLIAIVPDEMAAAEAALPEEVDEEEPAE